MTRKHVRATVELTVEFELEGRTRCQATCRDLGLGGAFLVTAETADLGTMLSLFLQLPGKGDPVVLEATVRWETPDGMGIQFDSMGVHETRALIELMKSGSAGTTQ